MKTLISKIIALALLSSPVLAADKIKIADYKNLELLMEDLAVTADQGGSLAYFAYDQSFWYYGDFDACPFLSKKALKEYFGEFAHSIYDAAAYPDQDYEQILEQGLLDFDQVLTGIKGPIKLCKDSYYEFMAFYEESYILSPNLRLKLTKGFED